MACLASAKAIMGSFDLSGFIVRHAQLGRQLITLQSLQGGRRGMRRRGKDEDDEDEHEIG